MKTKFCYMPGDPAAPSPKDCRACNGTGRTFVSKADFDEMLFVWQLGKESKQFIQQKRQEYLKDHSVMCEACQGRGEC
jgi:hypothetical protein